MSGSTLCLSFWKEGTIICDFISWIEKDGKLYWSRDDEVEAKYGDVTNQHCGHSTIRELHKLSGGTEYESALKIPREIAASVNRGEMKKLAKAGGWYGAHYTVGGVNNTSYWLRFKKELKKYKGVMYTLDNHGLIDPEWRVFDTRGQARDQAWDQAWGQAWDQARDQDMVIPAVLIEGYETSSWYTYCKKRLAIWEAGYGVLCDINGIFYVYKSL